MTEDRDNGHKEEVRVKMCPFLNQYCIEGRCALYSEVRKTVNGRVLKMDTCAFNTMMMMLSEINQKTEGKQPPKIHLPGLKEM